MVVYVSCYVDHRGEGLLVNACIGRVTSFTTFLLARTERHEEGVRVRGCEKAKLKLDVDDRG